MIGINYNFKKRRMIEANRGRRIKIKIKRPNIIYTGVLGAGGWYRSRIGNTRRVHIRTRR